MEPLGIVILAAGKGTRMPGDQAKVLVQTREKALIEHVLDTACDFSPERIVVVTGYQAKEVEQCVSSYAGTVAPEVNVSFALQEEQNGTGDAVRAALPALADFSGPVAILYGDVPLIKTQTLKALLELHNQEEATLSLISIKANTDNSRGRVIRNEIGGVERVTEVKDCTDLELHVDETNSGIYIVDSSFLFPAIEGLDNNNAQGEYYLTDIVERAAKEGQTVAALQVYGEEELQGVNTLYELSQVNRTLEEQQIRRLLDTGVNLLDPGSLHIDSSVEVAAGATIGPNVILRGATKIESGVVIDGSVYLEDVTVKEGAHIKLGLRAEQSEIGSNSQVGPFSHLRPETVVGPGVKVGNFVETKKTTIDEGAKVPHMSYVGNSTIGKKANIGAGTVFANYDGYNKFPTEIGDGAFVGSNSTLIAPVTLGKNAVVGGGSTLSKSDIEEDALVVARAREKKIPGWAKKRREEEK